MKLSATASVRAFLAGTTAVGQPWRRAFTVTPQQSGGLALPPLYWTDHYEDVTVDGVVFRAGGVGTGSPIPRVTKVRRRAGVTISDMEITLNLDSTVLAGGLPLAQVVGEHGLDGAGVLVQRVFMDDSGAALDPVHEFQGRVGPVRSVRATEIKLTVECGVASLITELPRTVVGAQCQNMLYDSICGQTPQSWLFSATIIRPSTRTTLNTDCAIPTGTAAAGRTEAGWFGLGVLQYTNSPIANAALAGVRRGVRKYYNPGDGGVFVLDRPLPADPNTLDVVLIWPGCPRTLDACKNADPDAGPSFNNLARYRGFHRVPKNEAAT